MTLLKIFVIYNTVVHTPLLELQHKTILTLLDHVVQKSYSFPFLCTAGQSPIILFDFNFSDIKAYKV
jgi:hypothetical protein